MPLSGLCKQKVVAAVFIHFLKFKNICCSYGGISFDEKNVQAMSESSLLNVNDSVAVVLQSWLLMLDKLNVSTDDAVPIYENVTMGLWDWLKVMEARQSFRVGHYTYCSFIYGCA